MRKHKHKMYGKTTVSKELFDEVGSLLKVVGNASN
jgi:hypothetical protein